MMAVVFLSASPNNMSTDALHLFRANHVPSHMQILQDYLKRQEESKTAQYNKVERYNSGADAIFALYSCSSRQSLQQIPNKSGTCITMPSCLPDSIADANPYQKK